MKKLLITILLLGLTGCSLTPPFGGVDYKEVKMVEEKIGDRQVIIWQDNKTKELIETETTEKEMDKITKENYQPKKDGYTFYGARGDEPIIEKKAPSLKDKEYYIESGDKASGTEKVILKKDGKLTETKLDKLK